MVGGTLPYQKAPERQRDWRGLRSSHSESLLCNSVFLGLLGKQTTSQVRFKSTPVSAQPVEQTSSCEQLSSHLFICVHCPVKTSFLWNWWSRNLGDGPSAWFQMVFMNLEGFAWTVHCSRRNYQLSLQLWDSAFFFFFLDCSQYARALVFWFSFATHMFPPPFFFFSKSSAFNLNMIGRNNFVPQFSQHPHLISRIYFHLNKEFCSKHTRLIAV
jgi:hypothetical protein